MWVTADVLFSTASIIHLCAMSCDRYLSLKYPLKYGRNKTKKRVALKIFVVWAISAGIALPLFVLAQKDGATLLQDGVCFPTNRAFIIGSSIGSFYLPLIIMTIMYAMTIHMLRDTAKEKRKEKKIRRFSQRLFKMTGRQSNPEVKCGVTQTQTASSFISREQSPGVGVSGDVTCVESHTDVLIQYDDSPKFFRKRSSSREMTGNGRWRDLMADREAVEEEMTEYCGKVGKKLTQQSSYESQWSNSVMACGDEVSGGWRRVSSRKNKVIEGRRHKMGRRGDESVSEEDDCGDEEDDDDESSDREKQELTPSHNEHKQHDSNGMPSNSVRNQNISNNRNTYKKDKAKKSYHNEQRAAKILGIVFGAFVILWSPFFITYCTHALCEHCRQIITGDVLAACTWLGYISSMINPFIYSMFNKQFRRAFTQILCCNCSSLSRHRRPIQKTTVATTIALSGRFPTSSPTLLSTA